MLKHRVRKSGRNPSQLYHSMQRGTEFIWCTADGKRSVYNAVLGGLADQGSQSFAVGSARGQLGSVAQDDRVFAVKPRLEPLDRINVDHRGPMDAQEAVGIQSLLEALETVSQHVLLRADMYFDVIAGRLEPIDFSDANEVDSLLRSDGDSALGFLLRTNRFQQRQKTRLDSRAVRLLQPPKHVLHRSAETSSGEWLEQIIDRMHLECAKGEGVIRSDENHRRRGRRIELLQDLEAVHLRHLYVQKHQRRPRLADHLQRLLAVLGLAGDLHLREFRQQCSDAFARKRLIVGDHGRYLRHRTLSGSRPARGMVTTASAPEPGCPLSTSPPRAPYSCSRRRRLFDKPTPSGTPSEAMPAPSSETMIWRESASPRARMTILPAPARRAIPWWMAFSTSGWRMNSGTRTSSNPGSTSTEIVRRSPNRILTILRYGSSTDSSSRKGTSCTLLVCRLRRSKSPRCVTISSAASTSRCISVEIECKALKRKWG